MIWELIICTGLGFTGCSASASFPNAKACYMAVKKIETPLNSAKTFYCKPAEEKAANV